MSCKVEKNEKNGKINKILNKEGKPSVLFQQIFNTPTLTLEGAIDIYKSSFSDKIKQEEGEPIATFNGLTSYSEAVKNTPINDPIVAAINDVTVATIENKGDINNLVRQDILDDKRELSP